MDRHEKLARRMLPDIIVGLAKLPPIPDSVALVTIAHGQEEWEWARVKLADVVPWAQAQLGPPDAELKIWLMVCKGERTLKRIAVWVPKGGLLRRNYTLH